MLSYGLILLQEPPWEYIFPVVGILLLQSFLTMVGWHTHPKWVLTKGSQWRWKIHTDLSPQKTFDKICHLLPSTRYTLDLEDHEYLTIVASSGYKMLSLGYFYRIEITPNDDGGSTLEFGVFPKGLLTVSGRYGTSRATLMRFVRAISQLLEEK